MFISCFKKYVEKCSECMKKSEPKGELEIKSNVKCLTQKAGDGIVVVCNTTHGGSSGLGNGNTGFETQMPIVKTLNRRNVNKGAGDDLLGLMSSSSDSDEEGSDLESRLQLTKSHAERRNSNGNDSNFEIESELVTPLNNLGSLQNTYSALTVQQQKSTPSNIPGSSENHSVNQQFTTDNKKKQLIEDANNGSKKPSRSDRPVGQDNTIDLIDDDANVQHDQGQQVVKSVPTEDNSEDQTFNKEYKDVTKQTSDMLKKRDDVVKEANNNFVDAGAAVKEANNSIDITNKLIGKYGEDNTNVKSEQNQQVGTLVLPANNSVNQQLTTYNKKVDGIKNENNGSEDPYYQDNTKVQNDNINFEYLTEQIDEDVTKQLDDVK